MYAYKEAKQIPKIDGKTNEWCRMVIQEPQKANQEKSHKH